MKLIATTALAALLACPAVADFNATSLPIYCTHDYNDLVEFHGDLKVMFGPIVNESGYGISVLENDKTEVLVALTPDGRTCVIWDHTKAGDPA